MATVTVKSITEVVFTANTGFMGFHFFCMINRYDYIVYVRDCEKLPIKYTINACADMFVYHIGST